MNLKNKLRNLMDENQLTLTLLSRKTGIPKQTIHNWLCGSNPRSLDHLRTVSLYFNVSIEELCFDVVDKNVSVKLDEKLLGQGHKYSKLPE